MKKQVLHFCFALVTLAILTIGFTSTEVQAQVVGENKCVCKGTSCEPSAFISFRKGCGKEPCKNVITDPVIVGPDGPPMSSGCV